MRTADLAACLSALAILVSFNIQTHAAGALATGRCGAFGYAFDDLSPEAAALRARAQCKGQECKVVSSFRRSCTAFAVDAINVCGAHAWANAPTADRARTVAGQVCHKYGGRHHPRVGLRRKRLDHFPQFVCAAHKFRIAIFPYGSIETLH